MPQNTPPSPRHFSTAARVHPAPPQLHATKPPTTPNVPKAGGRAGKFILPAASLLLLGVLSTTPLSPLHSSPSPAESEQRTRNAALMDAYGDRMSLADIEKALEAYEVR